MAYAKCVAYAVGNPLYHWTHLELQRFFGIYEPLNEKNAPEIWKKANEIIKSGDFFPHRNLSKKIECLSYRHDRRPLLTALNITKNSKIFFGKGCSGVPSRQGGER
ncbi:MAG: glucuronate isomerase [Clostridiales bacterium]|nr:MAG: glucuronate isomerase [Clostridiales bacterium]